MAEFFELDWKTNVALSNTEPPKIPFKSKDRKETIECLKNLIRASPDLELKTHFPQDDANLLKFLNARKFDLQETFTLVQNYYWYRKKNAGIFKNYDLSSLDIRSCYENVIPGVLSSKDRKGRCVLIFLANNWDCTYGLISVYRALMYSLEYLLNDVHNQSNGFVVIVDWTEFTFKKTSNLSPGVLKLMIEGLQNCFPARFKGVHFLGQPWYVEAALTVIKPFLNERIRSRIYVHGNNLSTLHEFVHKDILPAELGGERPSYNPDVWLKMLESQSQIL